MLARLRVSDPRHFTALLTITGYYKAPYVALCDHLRRLGSASRTSKEKCERNHFQSMTDLIGWV